MFRNSLLPRVSALTLITLATTAAWSTAQAAFVFTGGYSQTLPVPGNDYNTDLSNLNFDTMTTSAQLSVDQDGWVDFYYIGAESTYSNTFSAGGASITEPAANSGAGLTPFDFNGYGSPITIAVSAGDILDFQFSNDHNSNTVDNFSGSRLFDLGIVHDSSVSTLNQLVLAYDDQFSFLFTDDNHDDMLIRADFRPVPVPAAIWLFGSGLLGLISVVRRK